MIGITVQKHCILAQTSHPQRLIYHRFSTIGTMAKTANFTPRQTITEGKQAHTCNPCSVVYSSYFDMGVVTNRIGLSSISAKQDLSKALAS